MSTTEKKDRGKKVVTGLLGTLVVVVALVILCPNTTVTTMPKARQMKARADIQNLSNAVNMFKIDVGQYPKELEELITPPANTPRWDGPYLGGSELPVDPWGFSYHYWVDPKGYVVVSYGADGVEGGTGDDADVIGEGEGP